MKKIIIATFVGLFAVLSVPFASAEAAAYCGIAWGSLSKTSGNLSGNPLVNIRTGQHDCYDRMVLDINGGTAGYRVEYVDNLYSDGAGELIPLSGGAKLRVIAMAPAYDNNGQSTYPGIVGNSLPGVNVAGYQTFRDTKFAGSFEGQTTVGIGVRARLPFRVFTLDNKLVIDVAHYW